MRNISLSTATMFIINIIFGTSLYVNTKILISSLNENSNLVYLIASITLFPLIYALGYLASKNKGGNIYNLISPMGKNLSFSLVWAYSIAKIFTATISMLFSLEFLCFMLEMPIESKYYFFLGTILMFISSIYKKCTIDSFIQKTISFFKFVPVLTIIIFGFLAIKLSKIPSLFLINSGDSFEFTKVLKTVPIVFPSFSGFENIFLIADDIKNPKKSLNSVMFAFFSVSIVYFLYQTIIGNIIPKEKIFAANSFAEIFSLILQKVCIPSWMISFLMVVIFFAMLGGVYNSLYANIRNISKLLKKKNIERPYVVFFSGLAILIYGFFLSKNIIYTQQLGGLATITIYFFVAILCMKIPTEEFKYGYFFKGAMLISITSILISILKSISSIGCIGYLMYFLLLSSGFYISKIKGLKPKV